MEFAVEHLGNVVRVAPRGRIDSANADDFGTRLERIIASGCRNVLVDFRDVPYITSAGFRSLLLADSRVRDASGRIALCGMTAEIHRLFEMGAFTEIFTIVPTVEAAIAQLSEAAATGR